MPNLLRRLLRRNPTPASILRAGATRRHHVQVPILVAVAGTALTAAAIAGVSGMSPAAAGGQTRAASEANEAAAAAALPALRPAGDRPDAVLPKIAKRNAPTRPKAASRSMQRKPLHRWVRPYYGAFTSGFGYRWGRLHAGIDLAGPYGDPIVAATDGCISYAGPESGYGQVMRIEDWDGTETVYGHMSSFVRTSGCVHAGDVIARVGAAGDATGPHLHFEVRIGGVPVNPVPFLAKRGILL